MRWWEWATGAAPSAKFVVSAMNFNTGFPWPVPACKMLIAIHCHFIHQQRPPPIRQHFCCPVVAVPLLSRPKVETLRGEVRGEVERFRFRQHCSAGRECEVGFHGWYFRGVLAGLAVLPLFGRKNALAVVVGGFFGPIRGKASNAIPAIRGILSVPASHLATVTRWTPSAFATACCVPRALRADLAFSGVIR